MQSVLRGFNKLISRQASIFNHYFPVSNSPSFCSIHQLSASDMNVFVTRNVPASGVDLLKASGLQVTQWSHDEVVPRDRLLKEIKSADALFCLLTEQVDSELLDAASSNLKVVSTMSVGYDHIDISECKKRGIRVGYTPDVLTHATAELTVALLLATSRRLIEGAAAAKDGTWGTWMPTWLCGPSLQHSTVGILGFGRIGQAVAKKLEGFEVGHTLYTNKEEVHHPYAQKVEFYELLRRSDFLIVCASLNESTHGIFNKDAFQKMKESAILINTARGPIVDMDDLASALETKQIAAAGLDVTVPEPMPLDHRLLKLPNCVILPHIGSATNEARSAMSSLAVRNILAALNGEQMPAEVAIQ